MGRKTWFFAAIAAVASATLFVPGGPDAAALAQAASDQWAITAPAEPAQTLPQPAIAFVSEPVVQPLPAAPEPGAAAAARSLAELVAAIDSTAPLGEQLHCLAAAVYFEARGEPLAGQLAVAEVIINRSRDGRFASTYCGVVAQPGQFSFMRGRAMPPVRTGTPAWQRAVAIARIADQGLWRSEAGEAMFFHAAYVRPSWSHRKTRLAQIDTHIFYR
jgi:hypothetical protein